MVVAGSVVVVGGSVVVVVGSALVVVSSVVVGSTVVVGAVTVGWVVAAPNVVRAPVVIVRRRLVAGAPVVAGRVVVVGPPAASGALSGLVGDGACEVLGGRGRVVVDAAVGADSGGNVDGVTPPGGRPGVGGAGSWGTRVAEATKEARPKR